MKIKNRWRRRFCAWLAVLIGTMSAPVFAFASTGYELLHDSRLVINDQMTLHEGIYFNHANAQRTAEHYMVYEPGKHVTPLISYGNDVHGAAGISRIYEIEEKENGRRIVAASNGDYFTMATGVSLGAVIKDGILRTDECSGFETIGFDQNGKAHIGRIDIAVNVQHIDAKSGFGDVWFNKTLTKESGVVLYTEDFGPTNEATRPTKNVRVRIDSGMPKLGKTLEGTVIDGAVDAPGASMLSKGEFLLSLAQDTAYTGALAQLEAMEAGDRIDVMFQVRGDRVWESVEQAVGAERRLVTGGRVETFTDTSRAPRTALGIKSDGAVVLFTVDGRQSGYSMGMTYAELAARMRALGCMDAVNLDGGDSTMLFATLPGYEGRSQVNRHSGSSLRRCGNYILFENHRTPTQSLKNLHVYPYDVVALSGTKIPLEVRASDSNYYYVPAPSSGIQYRTSDSRLGNVDENGVFTAGSHTVKGTVSAQRSGASGSANISVISSPDRIELRLKDRGAAPEKVSVKAGETIVFDAAAFVNRLEIRSDAAAYSWSVDPSIGTVDESGVFTATMTGLGKGVLSVQAGSARASVELTVVTEGRTLQTFESADALAFEPGTYGGLTAAIETNPLFVHNGYRSLALSYSYDVRPASSEPLEGEEPTPQAELRLPMRIAFADESPTMISAWVHGNGRAEALQVDVRIGGERQTVVLSELSDTGWKHVHAQLPQGVTHVEGLSIRAVSGRAGSGTVYVDQLMAGFGYYVDFEPPTIALSAKDDVVSGTIDDNLDREIDKKGIRMTFDGTPLSFTYDAQTKRFSAALPASDGLAHRLLVRASDKSGNIGRAGMFYTGPSPEGEEPPKRVFSDMSDSHWGTVYAEYLYRQDILTGRLAGDKRLYDPDRSMTRQEFAAVIARWLDLDLDSSAGGGLPFADASRIQNWAKEAVQAVADLGYMTGRLETSSHKLYFDPDGPISRQEAMTVIGRIQEKGYGEGAMNFSDTNRISSWALPYVRSLVGQGVIAGYDGKLHPLGAVTRAQIAKIIAELN